VLSYIPSVYSLISQFVANDMVIKLYGDPEAINVRRAIIAFLETNTPYETHNVNWRAGELGTEASLAKQPFGQMPYMVRFAQAFFTSMY
jgi:hypothetical protein